MVAAARPTRREKEEETEEIELGKRMDQPRNEQMADRNTGNGTDSSRTRNDTTRDNDQSGRERAFVGRGPIRIASSAALVEVRREGIERSYTAKRWRAKDSLQSTELLCRIIVPSAKPGTKGGVFEYSSPNAKGKKAG